MARSTEVFAVFGPTASGKTAVAEALADRLSTEVVSADALQVYRGLAVLTNQPTRPTRLVAIRALSEEMSVGEYAELAHAAIDELVTDRETVVVAGGTGLYLRAAIVDLEIPPKPSAGARERWEAVYDGDPSAAYGRLALIDPEAAARVHRNDRRRVVRALELAEVGASLRPTSDRLWTEETRRPTVVVGLEMSAEKLECRIVARTREMFERGVVEEVAAARREPWSKTAEKALGLVDVAELAPGEAFDRIVARTRRYAAYQRKWMRRIPGLALVSADRPAGEVAAEILALAGAR